MHAVGLDTMTDFEGMTALTVYVVLFTLVFVESGLLVGFALPGDSVLFAVGLLAAAEDGPGLSLTVLCVGAFVAAVSGDAVGYWSGRRWGRPFLERRSRRLSRHLPAAERFYERWGGLAVVIARFIPWVRTFTPILAGVARMPYPRFLAANVVGALSWAVGLIVLGYAAAGVPWLRTAAYVVAATAIAAGAVTASVGVVRAVRARRAAAG